MRRSPREPVSEISASYAISAGTRSEGETIAHSRAPMIAW